MPRTCSWPGCERLVPASLWGCKSHWFRLPKAIRDRIWATYVPGQELGSPPPSAEYQEAFRLAHNFALRADAEVPGLDPSEIFPEPED